MGKWKDRQGEKYSRLTAIEFVGVTENTKKAIWKFKCDCGNEIDVRFDKVKNGDYVSCGCLRNERRIKHGMRYYRIYSIWCDMKKRCNNENQSHYGDYGGRGIKVCEEWNDSFLSFYNWSIGDGYNDKLTIDRINVNGNYEPNNCRWVEVEVQHYNKRNTIYIDINGENKTIKELSEEFNLTYNLIYNRYRRGKRGLDLVKGGESI